MLVATAPDLTSLLDKKALLIDAITAKSALISGLNDECADLKRKMALNSHIVTSEILI